MITKFGLLKSGQLTVRCDRLGQPVVSSWGKTRESQPSFFHEKTQHDGTVQSIVHEVIPRDRSGQPVVIPQRGARQSKLSLETMKQKKKCQWKQDHP